MRLFFLLPVLCATGCVYINDDVHNARLDQDKDGTRWPADCDDGDPDVQVLTWYRDADEDGYGDDDKPFEDCDQPTGYVATSGDCDDEDAERNPGVIELCNDVDDNCDSQVDNDAEPLTFYRDSDEDGFGDDDVTAEGCDAPSGYVEQGGDCNDATSSVHPDAPEFCDDVDQDCDGEVLDTESVNAETWYLDSDVDGFGDVTQTTTACNAPAGYSANSLDCDDSVFEVNPDAQEVCDELNVDEDCNGAADDNDLGVDTGSKTTFYRDDDGDGYGQDEVSESRCDPAVGFASVPGDCDDTNSLRNPGAPEECDVDNVDEDCDDLSDDNDPDVATSTFTSWFPDADGDGYGDVSAAGEDSCDGDSIYSADNDIDCDDTNSAISPAADEVCDDSDFDENCNGVADDDDAGTIDFTTWYLDGDGDTYGTSSTTITTCELPGGFTDNSDDCDDSDAGVNPDADEVWYDGNDQDCDGGDDYDADADGYQSDAYSGTDCDDDYDDTHPGATEICSDNRDNDCDGTSNSCGLSGTLGTVDALASLAEEGDNEGAGSVLRWVPDMDGDGSDELLVGAPDRDSNGSGSGSAYLVMGPITAHGNLGTATAEYEGDSSNDGAGTSLGVMVDGDGAGTPAVLIGGPGHDTYGTDAGVAWLVVGPQSGTFDLHNATATLSSVDAADEAGTAVASAGDVNNDGFEDLMIGGLGEDTEAKAGIAWLVHGPVTGSLPLDTVAVARLIGESSDDRAGESLSSAGDSNGDSHADLLIGAPRDDAAGSNAGAAYVWLGPVSGDFDLSGADAKLTGTGGSDLSGSVVALVGDVNDDGYDDVAIGSSGNDDAGTGAGAVYLFYGPVTTDSSLSAADVKLTGEAGGDAAGAAISGGGDVDSDGIDDLCIGAWGYEPSGGSLNGATYLFYGPLSGGGSLSTADVVFVGDEGYTGAAVAGGGDGNGDGYDDLAIGSFDSGVWILAGEGL